MQTKSYSNSIRYRFIFSVLLGLIFCQPTLLAQISAPQASFVSTTAYTSGTQDQIYIFCDEANIGVGELEAVSPDGTTGWNFSWTKWDSGTNSFGASLKTDAGDKSIFKGSGGLSNGLYRVTVEKGADVRNYKGWVLNHSRNENKPNLLFKEKDCDGVYFDSNFTPKTYKYNNYPNSDELVVAPFNSFDFILMRDDSEFDKEEPTNYNGSNVELSDETSFENSASYFVRVIDGCGFQYDSELIEDISTYVVKSDFTFEPKKGEAPLEVNFEGKGTNATDYQWYFYKNHKLYTEINYEVPAQLDDLLVDVVTDQNPVYTYMHPGEYKVKLIVFNNEDSMNCDDEKLMDSFIIVEESTFEVPNVFTPNGDGSNDEFRVKLFSVKSYSVKIFNRWGRMVHEFQESDVSPGADGQISSKGWDGKINGKLATPGTYFYVIEAEGREEEGKHYSERGSLTLLHDR